MVLSGSESRKGSGVRGVWLQSLLILGGILSGGSVSKGAEIFQGTNESFVAFEAEAAHSLGGTDWRIIDLVTPYNHPNPKGKTPVLLPTNTNASRGGAILSDFGKGANNIAVYRINFLTPGTYRWYIRDGAFENGGDPTGYGNEDSMNRPPAFNADPVVNSAIYPGFDPTYHISPINQTEGQYGWRNTGFTYTVTNPGIVEFRIRPRETGFSIDRMVFSTATNLGGTQLDAMWDSAVGATHFTGGAGTSDWSTADNWNNGAPATNGSPFIGGNHTVTLAEPSSKLFMLHVGHGETASSGNGSLHQNGGNVTIVDRLIIGKDGTTGVYNATGGTLTVGQAVTGRANLYVGYNTLTTTDTSVGTLNLQGASQFHAYLDNLVLGQQVANSPQAHFAQGTLVLAADNVIDAKSILVSASEMYGTIPQSVLKLGTANTLKTDLLTVAGSRGNALMKFDSSGTLDLTGSSGAAADLRIAHCTLATGTATDGTLDLTAGTVNATLDEIVIGYRAARTEYMTTSTGVLSFTAGQMTANSMILGQGTTATDGNLGQGIGTLNMGGGSLAVSGDVQLGIGTNVSRGTINLTGGSLAIGGSLLGGPGLSTVNLDGGTTDITGDVNVNRLRVGYNGLAATVTVDGTVQIGSGGDLDISRRVINSDDNTRGILDLSGADGIMMTVDSLRIGVTGTNVNNKAEGNGQNDGVLTLSASGPSKINATTILLGALYAGLSPSTKGTLHLGADNTVQTDTFCIGHNKATGAVDIQNGGVLTLTGRTTAEADLLIGYNDVDTTIAPAASTFDMTGGTLNATLDRLVVGFHQYPWNNSDSGRGAGVLTYNAGDVTAHSVILGQAGINPTYNRHGQGDGTLNLGGGTLTADSIILGSGSNRSIGRINLDGGTLSATSITKGIGTGIFNFTDGTLHVGTFGSSDIRFDLHQAGGVLAPGNSIGATTIYGNYTQAAGATLEIEIAGRGLGGVDYDLLTVDGNVDLDGQLLVRFLDGFSPAAGSVFDIIMATGTINIDDLSQPGNLPGDAPWTLDVIALSDGGSVLRLASAVPEPSAMLLAVLGLALLVLHRRTQHAA